MTFSDLVRPRLGKLNRRIDLDSRYPAAGPAPLATLATIYRVANAAHVSQMIAPALRSGWDIRLWGLDEVAPQLAAWTVGSGPGKRFELVNRLLCSAAVPDTAHVIVADDDVVFARRDIVQFLGYAAAAGADLAQPAHAPDSLYSWRFTLSAARTVARLTSFVEIGPIFSVSPSARQHVIPLPEEGMGWGIEFGWSKLREQGLRLAIVDAATVRHLGEAAGGYDLHSELAAVADRAAAAGFREIIDIQVEHGAWRPWQRVPPWVGS